MRGSHTKLSAFTSPSLHLPLRRPCTAVVGPTLASPFIRLTSISDPILATLASPSLTSRCVVLLADGDYLRYSHSELEFLATKFVNCTTVEAGYDDSHRRTMQQGHQPSRSDGVRVDDKGGWLESIHAFYIGIKN